MPEPPQQTTIYEVKNFAGMATNYDPTDLTPGVSELQINVSGLQLGELEVRRGLREVQFEAEE